MTENNSEDALKVSIEARLKEKYGEYVTRKQLAEEIGVSPQTIRRAEKAGRLPAIKFSSRCTRYSAENGAGYIVTSMV